MVNSADDWKTLCQHSVQRVCLRVLNKDLRISRLECGFVSLACPFDMPSIDISPQSRIIHLENQAVDRIGYYQPLHECTARPACQRIRCILVTKLLRPP